MRRGTPGHRRLLGGAGRGAAAAGRTPVGIRGGHLGAAPPGVAPLPAPAGTRTSARLSPSRRPGPPVARYPSAGFASVDSIAPVRAHTGAGAHAPFFRPY